jgi:hypothetical protein
MTGWPFRDHLPYQNGPVERWRMKGLEVGFGLIAKSKVHPGSDGSSDRATVWATVASGNGPGQPS